MLRMAKIQNRSSLVRTRTRSYGSWWTAAAAFSATTGSATVNAFLVGTNGSQRPLQTGHIVTTIPVPVLPKKSWQQPTSLRLYGSQRDSSRVDDILNKVKKTAKSAGSKVKDVADRSRVDDILNKVKSKAKSAGSTVKDVANRSGVDDILNKVKRKAKSAGSKVKDVAKSVLPSSWFQSAKEKEAAMENKRIEKQVRGSLKEIFKDAPLPIRMLGGIVGPIMSSVMSKLSKTIADQQEVVEALLDEARSYITGNEEVENVLGQPVTVGSAFSQSSSSTSINGQTSSHVELGFPVSGPRGSVMGRLIAINGKIQQLEIQAAGQVIQVALRRPSQFFSGGTKRSSDSGKIIEAEIIEKEIKP
jgi:hypothetical protein